MIAPKTIHEAMQAAPHDGQLYRQARAAIKAMATPAASPRCPSCATPTTKNPKHAEHVWECLACRRVWMILLTSEARD